MAMTVVADALVFHAALSEAEMEVRTTPPRPVKIAKRASVAKNVSANAAIGRMGTNLRGKLLADLSHSGRDRTNSANPARRNHSRYSVGDS